MNDAVSFPSPAVDALQTDRLQNIARYMNSDGAAVEWLALGSIFVGMSLLIFLLKLVANRNARKREEALRERIAKRSAAETTAPVRGRRRSH